MRDRILNFKGWTRLWETVDGKLNRDRIEELVRTELGTDRIWWQAGDVADPDNGEVVLTVFGIKLSSGGEITDTELNLVFREVQVGAEDPFGGLFPYPEDRMIMTAGSFQYIDTWVPVRDRDRSDREGHFDGEVLVELKWRGGQIEDDLGLIGLLRSKLEAQLYFEDHLIRWEEPTPDWDWEVIACDKIQSF